MCSRTNSQGLQCREVRKQSIGQGRQTIRPEAPDDSKIRAIERKRTYSRTNDYCISGTEYKACGEWPGLEFTTIMSNERNTDTRHHNVVTFNITARGCNTFFCILRGAPRPCGSRYHRRRVQARIQALRPSLSSRRHESCKSQGDLLAGVVTRIRPLATGLQPYEQDV